LGRKESTWQKIGCPVKKVPLFIGSFVCGKIKIPIQGGFTPPFFTQLLIFTGQ